jgi:hypothetical protein
MPAAFGGTFAEYALKKSAQPGATRTKVLLGWVKNLAKLRGEFKQKIRTKLPPYHHFDASDIAIIQTIARDGRYSEEVASEFLLLLQEIYSRNSEILDFNESLYDLRAIAEELKRLELQPEVIAQQKALLAQQKTLLAQQKALLVPLQQELALQQQEFALQQQEFAKQKALFAQQKQELALQQQEHKQQQKQFDKKQQSHQNVEFVDLEIFDLEIFQDNIFTLDVMEEPVIAPDGYTYEKRCILEWFRTKRTSPTTGAVLSSTQLIPNHSLKSQINQWREQQLKKAVDDKKDTVATVSTVTTVAAVAKDDSILGELHFVFGV